jgi:D-cysteine desulfhydrase
MKTTQVSLMKQNYKLVNYNAPKWLEKSVKPVHIPRYRLNLGIKCTDIDLTNSSLSEAYNLNGNYRIFIKRDDLNHSQNLICGNKIRKFEFLLPDAIQNKCEHIITAGGLQSNQARTVAILANMLNMKAHLFLRSHSTNLDELNNNGNLLLNRLFGAQIHLVKSDAKYFDDIKNKMVQLQACLLDSFKQKSLLLPINCISTKDLFGYINAYEEMLVKQKIHEFIDDIVVTCSSGSTMAAIAIGNLLTGSKFKIHAFYVRENADYFYSALHSQLKILNLTSSDPRDLVNMIDANSSPVTKKIELENFIKILRATNTVFDPYYTLKGFYGLLSIVQNEARQTVFKGKRILFIHTGGMFSLFDGRFSEMLQNSKGF